MCLVKVILFLTTNLKQFKSKMVTVLARLLTQKTPSNPPIATTPIKQCQRQGGCNQIYQRHCSNDHPFNNDLEIKTKLKKNHRGSLRNTFCKKFFQPFKQKQKEKGGEKRKAGRGREEEKEEALEEKYVQQDFLYFGGNLQFHTHKRDNRILFNKLVIIH